MVNKVMLIGYVGNLSPLRFTAQQLPVLNFSVATTERWKDTSGQRQEHTEWHTCVVWGKSAENAAQLLGKGRLLYIEGRLRTQTWQDDEQRSHRRTQLIVDIFKLLDRKDTTGRTDPENPSSLISDASFSEDGLEG